MEKGEAHNKLKKKSAEKYLSLNQDIYLIGYKQVSMSSKNTTESMPNIGHFSWHHQDL